MNTGEQVSGRYVYCIIKSMGEKKNFGNIGFGGEEVYSIDYRDFSPVISNTPMKKYDVNDKEVEIHRHVIEQVMKEQSVIPAAYGMAFKNKKLILVAMSAGYQAIKKAMAVVDNKIELGVKVFLPKDVSLPEAKRDQCRSDFTENLKRVASDSKDLKLFSDRLVLNKSFLVQRDRLDEFSGEVDRLRNIYADLKTQYSGPWPPYNFVDINILSKKRGGFR